MKKLERNPRSDRDLCKKGNKSQKTEKKYNSGKEINLKKKYGKKVCMREKKILRVDQSSCQTSKKGIYGIGDICNYPGKLKLILTGFAEAAAALLCLPSPACADRIGCEVGS